MESGEEYLSIVLLGNIKVTAFKNKDKDPSKLEDDKKPDYKGDGVAIWINKKK